MNTQLPSIYTFNIPSILVCLLQIITTESKLNASLQFLYCFDLLFGADNVAITGTTAMLYLF